jgi:sulfatase maturation enzyme AslB (radical SAM superfamily)
MVTYDKLFLGSECNNNCIVCPARGEEKVHGLNELISQVDALSGPENVELWGGEPTLHKGVLSLISHARSRGVRRIKLVTNGRRMAEWDFLKTLVEDGCRLFEIKIQGSRPEIHQAVTRVRGSFDQTVQGLQNLNALSSSEEYGHTIYIAARMAVTRANLEDLIPTVALVVSLGVDRIVFSRSGSDFPISDGALMVANAVKVAALNRVWSVCEGFPPCLMTGCETHVANLLQPSASQSKKPKGCRRCAYVDICTGPPEDYVRERGAQEFQAVSASPYLEDLQYLMKVRSLHAKG